MCSVGGSLACYDSEMIDFIVNAWNDIVTHFLENPVAQGLGYVAFGFSVYNFLFCKDKKFIIITAIVSAIFGAHFLLIGATAAGLINIFDVAKNTIALYFEKNRYRVIGLTVVYLVIGYFTYSDPVSVIPTITAIISTYLVFYVRGVWLNVGFLGIVMLYMIYNYTMGSQGGLMTDVFLFFFGIVGIVRKMREQ